MPLDDLRSQLTFVVDPEAEPWDVDQAVARFLRAFIEDDREAEERKSQVGGQADD